MFGRLALIVVAAVAGALLGYATAKPEKVKSVAADAIRTGVKAKDWTVNKYEETKAELKSLAKDAKKEPEKAS